MSPHLSKQQQHHHLPPAGRAASRTIAKLTIADLSPATDVPQDDTGGQEGRLPEVPGEGRRAGAADQVSGAGNCSKPLFLSVSASLQLYEEPEKPQDAQAYLKTAVGSDKTDKAMIEQPFWSFLLYPR